MTVVWLNTSIASNKLRLFYLISLIPLIVVWIVFIYLLTVYPTINESFWNDFVNINSIWITIIFIRMVVWIFFQKQIIFAFTWSKEITRKQNPEIYNIVENLCISRWLVTPKIGIIEDNSINAFATWWTKKSSWIVFSRWILNRLNKKEIEAVAWHELTHIINWDVKNMVIINVFIWAIWTIWYTLMRMKSGNSKKWNPLILLWLFLYLASIILLPLVNLAISRKKEYLADAWSVELTHDKDAMISALQKISTDSAIEQISSKWQSVSSMFIWDPKKSKLDRHMDKKRGKPSFFSSFFSSLFSTHPPIESRIEALRMY